MHLAIVSTTVHGESGYLPFDRLVSQGPFSRVNFVIAGDLKSAPFRVARFECDVEYLDPIAQSRYVCSESIGWNKIMRRNTALLRAIELDPDYILMVDDDNTPDSDYFENWHEVLTRTSARALKPADGAKGSMWHNYLATADAPVPIYARGFPVRFRGCAPAVQEVPCAISPDQIGVFQGISIGDPDIDAMTRIVYPDQIHRVHDTNYCLQDVWSPLNTQNTMFARDVFPLAFVWPHCGRYDDIYSSFMWQRFLFNRGMYTHIGEPVNRQDRGFRDVLCDLKNEVEGYLHAHEVWAAIDTIDDTDSIRFIERLLSIDHAIVQRQHEFLRDYLKDLAAVMPACS